MILLWDLDRVRCMIRPQVETWGVKKKDTEQKEEARWDRTAMLL
jgi:hypothetical protein